MIKGGYNTAVQANFSKNLARFHEVNYWQVYEDCGTLRKATIERKYGSMDELVAHFQDNAVGYGIGGVCLIPVIYVTRKYSVPLILYIVEFTIYAVAMHVVTWCVVTLTRWFKEQSSMRALRDDGRPEDAPEWGTPLIEFWKREEYDPNWVWIVEVILLVIILGLMWRYRPMKIQRKPQRKTQEFGKSNARSNKTGGHGAGTRGGKPGFSKGRRGR